MTQATSYQVPGHPTGLQMRLQVNEIVFGLLTQNSGPTPPNDPQPLMMWGDTTANRLKQRTSDNSGWNNIGPLDDFLGDLRTAITNLQNSINGIGGNKVSKAGDEMTGRLILKYGDPTLHFKNTGKTGAFIHVNDGRFYVLRSTGIGTDVWNALPGRAWPLELNLDTGDSYFAGNVFTSTYGWLHDKFLYKAGDTLNEVFNNGWYRSNGAVGWYSQTYGGGINMADWTWVQIYGGKYFKTDWHQFHGGGDIWTASYGWLQNRFATRWTALGQGGERVIANCGSARSIEGYEVFDVGDGRHQVRALVRYYPGNCNCACNCCGD